MRPKILVVGRDKILVEMFLHTLTDGLFADVAILDRLHAVTPAVAKSFDFTVVTDSYHSGNAPGIDLAIELYKAGVNLILVTVFASHENAVARVQLENVPMISMPFPIQEFFDKVSQLTSKKETE